MTGSLLLRCMIAGIVAMLIAFIVALAFGKPQVELAIEYEEQVSAAAAEDTPEAEEPPVVTSETQGDYRVCSLVGRLRRAHRGPFALPCCRFESLDTRPISALPGVAAFVATGLIPLLKYPANPLAAGFDDTIAARTTFHLVQLAASILTMVIAVLMARKLWDSRVGRMAGLIAGAMFRGLTAITFVALPSINEMPEGFDPLVIWNFRLATLGIHRLLWPVIGPGFGALAKRLPKGQRQRWIALA